jgi:hypothetical protein
LTGVSLKQILKVTIKELEQLYSADYLLGTEKSPVPADLETEDKIQNRIKMLTDFFYRIWLYQSRRGYFRQRPQVFDVAHQPDRFLL